MKYCYLFLITLLMISQHAHSQNATSFESWTNNHEYTKSSWEADGLTLNWVNGFDQSRAFIDNSTAASGSKSLRVTYPAGTYGPSENGVQAPLQVEPADEYYVTYSVRFSENFDWGGTHEGGKLPGLAGGDNCSGCSTCNGTNGFSARLMWRPAGRAVLYLYHMDKTNNCGDNLNLKDADGNDIYFEKGTWYKITQRVKVNSGNNQNGEVEVWVNDVPALLVTDLQFVNNGDQVDNLYFSTFHGGGNADWAPEVTCHTYFDDISIGGSQIVTGTNAAASSGHEVYPNPATSAFYIENVQNENLDITLMTPAGSKLSRKVSADKKIRISAGELPDGLYLLLIKSDDKTEVKKVVKK